MILVADSGSTKSDWILKLNELEYCEFRTEGINPFFKNEKDIVRILLNSKEIQPYQDSVNEVYFFGAGCSSPDRREAVSNGLTAYFKNAFISVDNDMVGSVYATCGENKGITCILGTGSNIALYDGSKVEMGKHGLGYILGDEASATYFGKKLITSFFYKKMPPDLSNEFKRLYNIDKEVVIKNVYQNSLPNIYLASFAKFMSYHSTHPYIIEILFNGFEEYIRTNIASFPEYKKYTCHFVGSISYYFKDILLEACKANQIKVGKILQRPIYELYSFLLEHQNKSIIK